MHSNGVNEADGIPARSLADAEAAILDSLVTTIVEARAGIAALQAFEARALAAAAALGEEQMSRVSSPASRDREIPLRSIAAELAAAVRTSDRSVQRQLNEAALLVNGFPRTLGAWGEGRISRAHVSVIVQAGFGISDPEARGRYEEAVLARAIAETPGRLAPIAKLLADRAQPRTLADRHVEARDGRGVRVTELADGMGELVAILPSVLARGIFDRLTEQARTIEDAAGAAVGVEITNSQDCASGDLSGRPPADTRRLVNDDRTTDHLRADILADMLLTG
ncbi:MAG TPA: DUF222 domain-containing protein, partial [Microbacterium sp.]|nr:DUF222 domain-containing protein [Microbacterium sp.]